MQTINCLLALGGDMGNTVPMYDITPAEVAVLREIHGSDAVSDIEVVGSVQRSDREERNRLDEIYANVMPNGSRFSPEVQRLFPGAAARVFATIDELGLPDDLFKAERRRAPVPAADPLDHDQDGKKGGSVSKAARAEKGVDGMTLPQLKDYAEENGIDLGGATKKADVLAAVKVAEAASEDETETTDEDVTEDAGEDGADGIGDMDDNLFE